MDSKICFEMIFFVVEATRERYASFMILTATGSEICGGQTAPLLTALSISPRSAFDGVYLQMSLSHGYLLRIRINQVREVYCQWIVIANGILFH